MLQDCYNDLLCNLSNRLPRGPNPVWGIRGQGERAEVAWVVLVAGPLFQVLTPVDLQVEVFLPDLNRDELRKQKLKWVSVEGPT